jgi:uncharacterized protein (DUF433 family)
MLDSGRARLAPFAAADELRRGFVRGVPPYVYVQRIQPANLAARKSLRPCCPGEPPDVIIRQAPAAQSVFRGVVRPRGLAACDVLQVWLDEAHLRRVEWGELRSAVRLYPFVVSESADAKPILIDPQISFGRPVVGKAFVSTRAILDRIDAGEKVEDVARDYELTDQAVEEAVVFERAA